jgi:ADP-dependent glucokinase
LIVPGIELFKKLGLKSSLIPKSHKNLNNLNEFRECFGYFFRKGSAAERSFQNLADFDTVLDSVKDLSKQQWFIGGNAALMAQSIAKRLANSEVLLVGPIGPKLKQLLNKNIKTPSSSLIESDEVHLILEYDSNEEFEGIHSPNANRFIVSHDIYNSRMEMLDEFFEIISKYSPDIIIISGLHLLESQSEQFRCEFKKLFLSFFFFSYVNYFNFFKESRNYNASNICYQHKIQPIVLFILSLPVLETSHS